MLIYQPMAQGAIKRSIKFELQGIVFLATFLITAALGYLSFNFSKDRLVSMRGESLRGIAATTAHFIDMQDILLIAMKMEGIKETYRAAKDAAFAHIYEKNSEREGREESQIVREAVQTYAKYVDLLSKIKTTNQIDSPINIYVKDANRLKLVLTNDDAMLIGTQYLMRPEAKEAFSTNSPQSSGIYKDKDGVWISAYAPIPSSLPLRLLAVIEINSRIDSYIDRLNKELNTILLVCLIGISGTTALSYKLVNRIASSIRKLDETATELGKENYDVSIDLKREDEIGRLALTFEKLRLSIREKLNELKLSLAREKKAHLESILALTNVIGLRDPYTKRHLYRVESYALLIAKAMRLSKGEREKLRHACRLHDIGKIGVESELLQKVKLSKEDFEQVKKHTEAGAKIIEGIQFLSDVRDIILHHQERYDGRGYPKGLKGEEIPLLARIVAVADAFDAMTTDRPYKSKVGFEEAFVNLEQASGTQFDPQVCKALLKYTKGLEAVAKKHFEGFRA